MRVLGRRAAAAAGSDGVVIALARADAHTMPGRVRVRVRYGGFASAYGGGFGSRLALFAMPACAATTPGTRACQAMTPLRTVNNAGAKTLSATVTLAPAGAGPAVIAASSTTSGGTGDFKATSLTPSSQWQVGLQTGDFRYSYPMRVPPPIAGAPPALALSYDSGTSDGETAQANSQPGQLGEGFSLAGGGFIERKYAACADHMNDSTNNTGKTAKTGDLCYDGYNGYLSLGGHSGQLIQDSGGGWRLAGDDGSTVLFKSNANNGSYNGRYWEIITPDGTQYYFGLNQLPGFAAGNQVTNSVWTVPVVGLKAGDPCNTPGSYKNSVCANMAWRWNLDLVVDPNGNATSYYYTPQTNSYAFNSTSSGLSNTWLSYDSGGTLSEIYYGSLDNASNGNNVYQHRPFHVTFGYSDRCTVKNPDGTIDNTTCDKTGNHTATDWPDVPWDLSCTSTPCSGQQHDAPAFFDTQMLTSVTTSLYEGSNPYQNVDTWTLAYSWLFADVNNDLVLNSISHAGDVGGSTTLPKVTFGWTQLNNRVPYDSIKGGGTFPDMGRYRINSVISETGAQTDVSYNPASCASSPPSDPSSNTLPCFQQKWAPGDLGGTPTTTSWFYKYTVSQVKTDDATGGQPPLVTSYVYCDTTSPSCTSNNSGAGGAWHYDTDMDLVQPKDKSYSQWRGYRYVHVITGASTDTQTETDYTFLRGMDSNPVKDSSGNWTYPPVTVQPTRTSGTLTTVTDANALNGFQLEKITLNSPVGGQVADQVSWPWTSVTATSAVQPWGQPLTAALTATAESDTYTPLSARAGGGTRKVQVKNTFDSSTGLPLTVSDNGDTSAAGQALCTTYSYPSPSSTAGLIDYADETTVTSGACGTTSPPLVSDTKYFYDSLAFGTAPTAGNVTETDVYSSGDPGVSAHWVKQSRDGYDTYGRITSSEDAASNTTTTTYISAYGTGRATTQVSVKTPLTTAPTYATTTTDLNPAWGTPTDTVDANSEITTYCYDPLGRQTAVWLPGQSGVSCSTTTGAAYTYAYSVSATAPPYVATTRLVGPQNIPITSYQIYDSLLRPRQTQSPAEGKAGGMEVTDFRYDSRGNTVISNGPFPANATPSGALWDTTNESLIPNETASSYDGANRITESDFISKGTQQWMTTWAYPGADAVTVTPPAGGTITTTYTDGRGRITEIDQYHSASSASGPFDATRYSYSYITGGQKNTITDAGGNTWAQTYDLLGRQISATAPDTGTTSSTYNDLGQLTSVTDAAGKVISWAYDAAGRKTGEYAAVPSSQTTANQLSAWTYDTPDIGQPATATAYVGGTTGEAYEQVINSYDQAYHPTSITYIIPSNSLTGALAGSYKFTASYNIDGTPATQGYPASGPLLAETVNDVYDNKGYPYRTTGTASDGTMSDYAEAAYYTPDGQPTEIDVGTSTSAQWSRMEFSYDEATLRLTQTQIQRESQSWANDTNTSYSYDHFGNVLSATDSVTGDNQCYTYDYLARLTAAWAQPSGTCPTTPPGASGLGGPAPYQQTLNYDNSGTAGGSTSGTTGLITADTLITGSGGTATTTQTTYTYPGYGNAQPHAPASYTTTTNGNAVATAATWTSPGQLASTTTGGTTTSYNWNGTGATPDRLASVTTGSTTTSYRYDTAGNLLLVKDGGSATLHLPGEDLTATGSTVTATRYYTLGNQVIAARTSPTAVSWLFPDPNGTSTAAIDASSQALTLRYYTPFGQPRGAVPATWPGTRGYIGGTTDTTTGLTNLGAREYNPGTPAFISPDPVLSPYIPAALDPYDYGINNPVTNSDPTGLCAKTSANAPCQPENDQTTPPGTPPSPSATCGVTLQCYTPPPVTLIGTVFFPSTYPHLHQILHIYNQILNYDQQNMGQQAASPSSQYRALFLTCQANQGLCSGTLMDALYHGGEFGTLMSRADYRAAQSSGQSPVAWMWTHGQALVWQNSASVSVQVGGLGALNAAIAGIVYRSGSQTPANMTPRPVQDPTGLSTWDNPEAFASGTRLQMINTSLLKSLIATPDEPPGHVSIAPADSALIEDWAAARPGLVAWAQGTGPEVPVPPMTQEILDAVVGETRAP